MNISLIRKYTIGERIQACGQLSLEEVLALTHYFIEGKILRPEAEKRLLTRCEDIYRRDLWLQCACTRAEVGNPVMRFKRSVAGRLYLFNIHSRGRHAERCPFASTPEAGLNSGTQTLKSAPQKKSGALNVLARHVIGLSPTTPAASSSSERQSAGERRPTLCNVLYRLLDDAGCNRLTLPGDTSPFKALEATLHKTAIVPGKALAGYFHFDVNHLTKAAIALREDRTPWPKDRPRHCFFLLNVSHFDGQSLFIPTKDGSTKAITVRNRIWQLSGRLGARTAPYMALVLVTDSAEKPYFYEPFEAFVVPRYSERSLVPVDSFFEREMLKHLFRLQYAMRDAHQLITLEKPLFGLEVATEAGELLSVLPDFLVRHGDKVVIVEVNGSAEESYLARKERTQRLMHGLGEVMTFDAHRSDARGTLTHDLMTFIHELRGVLC